MAQFMLDSLFYIGIQLTLFITCNSLFLIKRKRVPSLKPNGSNISMVPS